MERRRTAQTKTKKEGYEINEIFFSVNGEINKTHQGFPTVFIRFQGCNLKCWYCDTEHSQKIGYGDFLSVHEIFHRVEDCCPIKKDKHFGIVITGGEPLLQLDNEDKFFEFIELFRDNKAITIETNGTLPIYRNSKYLFKLNYVVDIKLRHFSNGKNVKLFQENINKLSHSDYLKVPYKLGDEKKMLRQLDELFLAIKIKDPANLPTLLFSPIFSIFSNEDTLTGHINFNELFSEEKDEGSSNKPRARALNIQLHKLIGVK